MAPIKIQLSKDRIAKDFTTVWQDAGPSVDIQMDLKSLTFRQNSVESIISFHVLDHLFEHEIIPTLMNWRACLAPGGTLICLVDDFEYIARAIVGADISIDVFNREHSHPTQFSQESILNYFKAAGFSESETIAWYEPIPDLVPTKKHYELLLAIKK